MTHHDDRILELLAEAALGGLTPEEQQELETAIGPSSDQHPEIQALELALANASIALAESETPIPQQLADQLVRDGIQRLGAPPHNAVADPHSSTPTPVPTEAPTADPSITIIGRIGWLAAAACLVFALVGWLRTPPAPKPLTQIQLASNREKMLASPDAITLEWQPWNGAADAPVQTNVTGDVVWSDKEQVGYLRFSGLASNSPSDEQYQLWIVDAERGMAQRISGGVFDADGSCSEFIVRFDPAEIPVTKAAAFAITVEQPGGTWVSDMTKAVVIASRG